MIILQGRPNLELCNIENRTTDVHLLPTAMPLDVANDGIDMVDPPFTRPPTQHQIQHRFAQHTGEPIAGGHRESHLVYARPHRLRNAATHRLPENVLVSRD